MANDLFNKSHRSRGMSLVELIVVMAILSVVMLAVMSLYIPAHQSTVAQTQVSDVQANLRLALRTMTRDLLHAGFLVNGEPISSPTASSFTINTRIVGNDFARIQSAVDGTGEIRLTVTNPDMKLNFTDGSFVRLFQPVNSSEVKEDPVVGSVSDADRAYPVDVTATTIDIDITANPSFVAADILPDTVLLEVSGPSASPLQTIQYLIVDDSLQRITGGNVQTLARNIDTDPANSFFFFPPAAVNSLGYPLRVDIKLTGKTKALKNDAISGQKLRSVSTSVKLRNVF